VLPRIIASPFLPGHKKRHTINLLQAEQNFHSSPAMRAADLKQNDHIFLQGRPCKVEEIAGRETVHVTGHDIFTGRRHEGEFPSTQDVEAFNIIRKEYELVRCFHFPFLLCHVCRVE
jgi:hypothetical protein